jgi:hypothetical protein
MKKLSALVLMSSIYLASAFPASAAFTGSICPVEPTANQAMNFNPLCFIFSPNSNIVGNIINIAFIVAVLVALAFLIYGGIKWITSGGDKSGVEAARNMIVAALVGLVITFLSYFILQIVFQLFGLDFASGNFWAQLKIF